MNTLDLMYASEAHIRRIMGAARPEDRTLADTERRVLADDAYIAEHGVRAWCKLVERRSKRGSI
jgi:hypothetical protein